MGDHKSRANQAGFPEEAGESNSTPIVSRRKFLASLGVAGIAMMAGEFAGIHPLQAAETVSENVYGISQGGMIPADCRCRRFTMSKTTARPVTGPRMTARRFKR
jgi:hypothetical protein